jgi:AraC family transcriptional regulator
MPDEAPQRLEVGRFFGTNAISRRGEGFTLSQTRYAAGLRVPQHFHEQAYFCLLLDGRYSEEYGRRSVIYNPMSIVFHPPQEIHHGHIARDGGDCFHVEIAPPWLARLEQHGRVPTEPVDRHAGELVELGRRLFLEFQAERDAWPLLVEGIALQMLGAVVRESWDRGRNPPHWLAAVVAHLHDEWQRPLTVEELAAEHGVSAVRLSRAFQKFHSESLGEYVRRLRVQFACRRLRDPRTAIADIAMEAGFSDQSHLTRVFKRMTGRTPAAYRREVGALGAARHSGLRSARMPG